MCQIRIQNTLKQLEQAKLEKKLKDQQQALAEGAEGGEAQEAKSAAATDGIKIIPQEFEDDNLITYKEFVQAVKSIKSTDDPNHYDKKFYESLLPRTLTFHDVLTVQRREEEYKIPEQDVEEFVVFRYELSNILRKHLNQDEK